MGLQTTLRACGVGHRACAGIPNHRPDGGADRSERHRPALTEQVHKRLRSAIRCRENRRTVRRAHELCRASRRGIHDNPLDQPRDRRRQGVLRWPLR